MELLLGFGGGCLVLLVLALVLREVTEQRLGRLRAELMQLRSQVRLLEERMKSYRSVRSQVREVLQRIDSRKLSANDSIEPTTSCAFFTCSCARRSSRKLRATRRSWRLRGISA